MAKRSFSSLYFADDRDISDLIRSSSKSFEDDFLLSLLRKRGIFLSRSESKDDIIDHVSMMQFDWQQLHDLLLEIGSPDRKEKSTSNVITIDGKLAFDHIEAAAKSTESTRSQSRDETYKIIRHGDNSLSITVTYTQLEYGKNRLLQRRVKELNHCALKRTGSKSLRYAKDWKSFAYREAIRPLQSTWGQIYPHHKAIS